MGNHCACVSDKDVTVGNKELFQGHANSSNEEDFECSVVKIQAHVRGAKVRRTYKSMKSDMNSDQVSTPHTGTKMHYNAETEAVTKVHGDALQANRPELDQLSYPNGNEIQLLQTNPLQTNTNANGFDGFPDFSKVLNKQESNFMQKGDLSKQSMRMSVSPKIGIRFLEEVPPIRNPIVLALLKKLPHFSYSAHKDLIQKNLHLPTYGPVCLDQGIVYIGQWKLGGMIGMSNMTSSNQNEVINGVRHGKGKQIWPDGSVYEGFWSEDQADGYGRLVHADGDYYEGEWQNDKAHGKGKYVHPDGAYYEGDWVKDLQEGHGVEMYSDGSVYTGGFLNGMKHGKGAFTWTDGSSYLGEFRNNKLEGKGRYVWSDGRVYEGDWVDSKMHGYGVFIWKDGRKYEGSYKNDKKDGYGVYYLGDGRKYEGQWKDGLQDGKGVMISASGKSRVGYWSQGKRLQWESSISHSGTTSKNEQHA